MHSFTRYEPQKKQKVLEQQLPERLRRTKNACKKLSQGTQQYVFNRTTDRQEIEFSIYRQRLPDNWVRSLKTLSRVKLKPRMFVINEDNDIDQDFRVKEALLYSVIEKVMSPTNPETEVLAYCNTRAGVFSMPRIVLERDELGNVTRSDVIGWDNMFYIPWDDSRSARKVLNEFNGEYRNTVLAVANTSGDNWHSGGTYSVPNLDEWLSEDFDTLMDANKNGFLKPETGGAKLYLKDQSEKRKRMEAEIKEYKKSDKTKG